MAIIASPLFGHYTTIFEGINKLISYVAPPITTVFLLGVFWKRASGNISFHHPAGRNRAWSRDVLSGFPEQPPSRRLHAHGVLAADCLHAHHGGHLRSVSLEPLKAGVQKRSPGNNWREPLQTNAGGLGLADYRMKPVFLILAVFTGLYFTFR